MAEVNNIWGEWEIISKIGEGSFGTVYKAKRQLYGKVNYSAIKVIHIPQNENQVNIERSTGASDDAIKEYFMGIVQEWQSEIEMLESLKSAPNVMVVEDYKIIEKENKIQWDIYIRMELLTPFTEYVHSRPFYTSDAIKLGLDICRALEYCSVRRIIHRDIKHENIFVSSFGDYKLGDFGIARQLEKTNSSLSKKGTYMFMAPEVYRGDHYDASVDIYSLGLVLYRLFNNNKMPFAPQDKELLGYTEREEILLRRIKGEDLPCPVNASKEISDIILKACAFNSKDRFSNPTEMLTALQQIQNELKNDILLLNIIKNVQKNETTDELSSSKETNASTNEENGTRGIFTTKYKPKTNVEEVKDSDVLIETPIPVIPEPSKIKADKPKKSKAPILLLIPLVIFLACGFLIMQNFNTIKSFVLNEVSVPNVLVMNKTDAFEHLEKIGLKVIIAEIEDDSLEEGTILEQSILADEVVKKGTEIELKVVIPIPEITISDYIGKTISEVKIELENFGLVVNITQKIDDNKPIDEIISQSIKSGEKIKKGSSIDFITIIHNEKVYLNSLIGQSESQAKDYLTSLGLGFKIIYEETENQAVGTVYKQSHSNININKGSIIQLTIAKAVTKLTVPDVKGKDVNQAYSQLNNLGLVIVRNDTCSNTISSNIIISQNPSSGVTVNKGSTINLEVSTGSCTWSEWTTTLPSDVTASGYDIESKTQYQFRDTETTTSNNSNLAGWNKYDEQVTGYGNWSNWSENWIAENSSVNVETRTIYKFMRYRWNSPTGTINVKYSYRKFASFRIPDYYQEIKVTSLSSVSYKTKDEEAYYYNIPYSNNLVINQWYGTDASPYIGSYNQDLTYNSTNAENNTEWYSYPKDGTQLTEYRYRDKIYTYYYNKTSAWSGWQDQSVASSTTREVQTQMVYRYRKK